MTFSFVKNNINISTLSDTIAIFGSSLFIVRVTLETWNSRIRDMMRKVDEHEEPLGTLFAG